MPSTVASRNLSILLVEDDEDDWRSLQLLLQWNGFQVRAHALAASALALETFDEFDLLVADYFLSDSDGVALLAGLREAGWKGRAVMITAEPNTWLVDRAQSAGYHAVLGKPLARHDLMRALLD